jgi:hypothetical protein
MADGSSVDATAAAPGPDDSAPAPPALKRFKLLSARIAAEASNISLPTTGIESPLIQMNKYISELQDLTTTESPLSFWSQRRPSFSLIADFAEDLNSAPASQAFVERVFSVCGMLTQGRRNRMSKSLEKRVCLKLNSRIFV